MKRLSRTTAVIAALVFSAGTAGAIPPLQGSNPVQWKPCDWAVPYPLHDCGDFYICEDGIGVIDWKVFFDSNGQPIKVAQKSKFADRVYEYGNPENYAEFLPLSYTYIVDLVEGAIIINGLNGQINIPGYGPIFREVGRIIMDSEFNVTFEAGEHDYWNGEWEALCEFLRNAD